MRGTNAFTTIQFVIIFKISIDQYPGFEKYKLRLSHPAENFPRESQVVSLKGLTSIFGHSIPLHNHHVCYLLGKFNNTSQMDNCTSNLHDIYLSQLCLQGTEHIFILMSYSSSSPVPYIISCSVDTCWKI